jgi:uncharacterized protein YkwD
MLGNTTQRGSARRRVTLLALVGFVLATTVGTTACESTDAERHEVITLVNLTRADNGLGVLAENAELDVKADAWAMKLRDACNLSHSRLADGAPDTWTKLGENVGYGGGIGVVHEAYLNSPGHRANILDPAYTSMGAAAVWGTCDGQHRVFTVQVFMRS